MTILRPDPAEYIEDFGCGPIRPVNVLAGALGYADAYGLTLEEVYQIATRAKSIRHFDRLVDEAIEQIRRAAA